MAIALLVTKGTLNMMSMIGIIMTTVAMIFGMLPLAFALGEEVERRAPMVRAVVGGLITSTLLTLFVVPAMHSVLDDTVERMRARQGTGGASVRAG